MKKCLVLTLLIGYYILGFADSPLTSTDFYEAYMDVPLVQKALKNPGKISKEAMVYLYDDTKPLDVKLAIINAIGWDIDRHYAYFDYIDFSKQHFPKNKYGFSANYKVTQSDVYTYASQEQKAVLIYLTAMADYFDTAFLARLLRDYMPSEELLNTQSFNLAISLVLAQICLDMGDWSEIYNIVNEMFVNAEKKMCVRRL